MLFSPTAVNLGSSRFSFFNFVKHCAPGFIIYSTKLLSLHPAPSCLAPYQNKMHHSLDRLKVLVQFSISSLDLNACVRHESERDAGANAKLNILL